MVGFCALFLFSLFRQVVAPGCRALCLTEILSRQFPAFLNANACFPRGIDLEYRVCSAYSKHLYAIRLVMFLLLPYTKSCSIFLLYNSSIRTLVRLDAGTFYGHKLKLQVAQSGETSNDRKMTQKITTNAIVSKGEIGLQEVRRRRQYLGQRATHLLEGVADTLARGTRGQEQIKQACRTNTTDRCVCRSRNSCRIHKAFRTVVCKPATNPGTNTLMHSITKYPYDKARNDSYENVCYATICVPGLA